MQVIWYYVSRRLIVANIPRKASRHPSIRRKNGYKTPGRRVLNVIPPGEYEVDPLTCPKCSGKMKLIGVIEEDHKKIVGGLQAVI
jgi:hypothetical protein